MFYHLQDNPSQSVDYDSDESASSQDSSFSQTQQERPTKKRKVKASEAMMEKAVGMLSSIQERSASSQALALPAEDEDLVFAKHIANVIRKIANPRDKALLKLKIQKLIFETLFQTNQTSLAVSSVRQQTYEAAGSAYQLPYSSPLSQMSQFMSNSDY